jgi:CubicO group peptidase (beta-lactamase class C family)
MATRARTEAGLAVLVAVLMVVAAAGSLWFASSRSPLYESAAAVPSTAASGATGPYARAVEDSRQLARTLVSADNLPGLSIALAVNGEIVWAEGFGWADIESRTPVTPLTRFRLGAASKPLTAVGAALLYDRGRLDLDAPIQRYVPTYPEKQWTVTVRQAMSDVAGVHRIRGDNNDAMPTAHCTSLDEAVALLAGDPLLFEPGTRHQYSVWGWVLVSAAIEGAAGEPFDRFMLQQVFEPLGMDRTVAEEGEALDDVAHGTGPGPDYSCVAGGGAFLSTPSDLVRLGSTMVKPGFPLGQSGFPVGKPGFLKAETVALLQTPPRVASGASGVPGASTTYALGWTVRSLMIAGEPTRVVSHRGSPTGGTVSLLTFPELGLAVAAAANMADAKGVDPLAAQVADAFVRERRR